MTPKEQEIYVASEYKQHENHWLIKQDSSTVIRYIKVEDV